MTRKKWLKLRRRRPELGLPSWTGLGRSGQKRIKKQSPEQVIADAVAATLRGDGDGVRLLGYVDYNGIYESKVWDKFAGQTVRVIKSC